jgi:mono/diheme cytochrome c family protein
MAGPQEEYIYLLHDPMNKSIFNIIMVLLGRRSAEGTLRSSVGYYYHGARSFHGAGGECHESRDQRTSNGGSNLPDDEELA